MSDLPKGWVKCRVAEIFDSFSGGTPNRNNSEFWNGEILWVSSGDVKTDKIFSSSETITKTGLNNSSARLCRPSSVLVVVRSGILKHTLPVAIAERELAINQDIKCFDCGNSQLNQWLFLNLRAAAKGILSLNREGTTVQSVKYETLKQFQLSVPPLNEQRRIVQKLEKLLGQVAACQKRLEKIPHILKRFRQSVLAAACSGRLTAEWREEHHQKETSHFSNELLRVTQTSDLNELPETWVWINLPKAGFLGRGKSRHRPRDAAHLYGGKYPFIQTGDVAQSGGRITSHKQTYNEAGLAQSKLWDAGTVCITIAANIADSAILTYPACFPDSIVGFVANHEICLPEYIEFFIRTARNDLSQFAPATAQKNINVAILNDLLVPLPPLTEQKEIVKRVETLFKLADQIEARYNKAKVYVDKLTQSILAKAFRGELVPQDPNDEPASVLLECIRKERAESQQTKKQAQPLSKKKQASLFDEA